MYFSTDPAPYIVVTPGNFNEEGGFRDKRLDEKYYTAIPPVDYVLRKGDLLVVMTEQKRGLIGASGIVPEDDRYLHNQRLGLVTDIDNTRISDDFLYYILNHPAVRRQLESTATGSKVRHTSPNRIADVRVVLPPLEDQRRATRHLRATDMKIAAEEARRHALATLFDTLLHDLMTARLRVADLKVSV